jgi:hypothetical protein
VVIEVDEKTGRAKKITRIQRQFQGKIPEDL